MNADFDVVVIGKGLVGTAAGKYLAAGKKRVAIVGAELSSTLQPPLVYASHDDQARIQRLVGKDVHWTRLNADSVQQYKNISAESGIDFHTENGCFYINPYGNDLYLKQFPSLAKTFQIQHQFCNATEIHGLYKNRLRFPDTSSGVLEYGPSGSINPLRLIEAQIKIFKQLGGIVYPDTVTKLTARQDGFDLETESNRSIHAKQVLVATGSFLNYLNLLPLKLSLVTKSEVVLLVRADRQTAADYSNLPTLLYEIDEADTEGVYVLQPVRYPDGYDYFKIGCNLPGDIFFESLEQIHHWFRSFDSTIFAPFLQRAFQKLFPSVDTSHAFTKKCIISRTEHGRPYIGETIHRGLFVAGGCNGYSAMCSDGIGRVASQLMQTGQMPNGYEKEAFELRYQ